MAETTTTPSLLDSAMSLLSAATGPSAAVAATANLLTEGLKLVEPLITDHQTHTYDQQVKDRVTELVGILEQVDSDARADRLARYFTQLCIDAGTPAIGLGGNVSVPLAFVLALATGNAKYIRDEAYLTTLIQNAAKGVTK